MQDLATEPPFVGYQEGAVGMDGVEDEHEGNLSWEAPLLFAQCVDPSPNVKDMSQVKEK